MPTIAGDTIVFVSEDDLWSVPSGGGVARRLTAGLGAAMFPRLSPDGSTIAFSTNDEHHYEVYVMPAEGGQPRRLTYLGAGALVDGWLPDGRIVFRSHAGQPSMRIVALSAVDPATGAVEPLGIGPATEIAHAASGAVALGRHTQDPARWKRYRGGRAGQVWVDPRGDGTFKRLLKIDGNLAHPAWVGDRVFFISDHEGIGNVYSCTATGRGLRRHTDHGTYYARFLSGDGSTLVYQHAAELWALDESADEPRRVDVDLASPRSQRMRKFVDGARTLQGYTVHPEGHSIAAEARGHIVTLPLFEGPVRDVAGEPGVRARLGRWLRDGERIVAVTDATGEERLAVVGPTGRVKRYPDIDTGRVRSLTTSPSADVVAVANHRNELLLVDLSSGSSHVLDRSEHGQFSGLAFSPDGAWLAYSVQRTATSSSIALASVAERTVTDITGTEFADAAPAWDPKGRYLYFLSYRNFTPVYDVFFFDLGFQRGARPYAVALRTDVPSPFLREPEGLGEGGSARDKADKAGKAGKAGAVGIELDGIGERVAAFPVPEARYVALEALEEAVLMLDFPARKGVEDPYDSGEDGGTLRSFSLKTGKSEHLMSGVRALEVSADRGTMVVAVGKRLRAVKAGEKPKDGTEHDPPGRDSGWLDLDRVRVSIDPGAEWSQMFGEAWRLQREQFWTEDLSGVDWGHVRERYEPLVQRVATRGEFADLIWEMQGELGTSHAYEMGGDHRTPPAYRMGYLGADVSFDGSRWRIDHIVRGDVWDEAASSPLARIGAGVREGDTILAVNGRPVGRGVPPQALLVNRAGHHVELRMGDASGKKPRTVVVKALASEEPARYREWIERTRAHVHEATKGRVGYLHIPSMMGPGFAEFHRAYLTEVERDGLIVDVRYNSGGHVSQLLLEKLARKRIGYDLQRWGTPESYPSHAVLGPIVCLTNEHAGSDGDIFTHSFKMMKLGPVVGTRTWGGVIGISPRHELADGGVTTQPEFAFWFNDVGFGVENHGAEPDHVVDNAPQDYAAARDPQMDKALSLIKGALAKAAPLPDFRSRPNLALPTLPPR